jgi:hypothetical protein
MATIKLKHGLPDAIERREILAGNVKAKLDLNDLGSRYLAKGWLSDAIDCFERTRNGAKLGEVKQRVIESDVFLLARLARTELVRVSSEDWRRAAERALADGRDRAAAQAFEKAGDLEGAERAKAKVTALRAELKPPTKGRGGMAIS